MKCISKFLDLPFRILSSILTLSLFLLISSYPTSLYAQECIGDYTLTSQTEIDVFNCTSVTGNLRILETVRGNITNLDGLSELASVGGHMYVSTSTLTNVDGLAALTSVGGYLEIESQYSLTNIDGLTALTSVGGNLQIYDNPVLTNVDGLTALTSIGGSLVLFGNGALKNVDGLTALTSVGGDLQIAGNHVLTNVDGLAALTLVGGDFNFLFENDALIRCCGLYRVLAIGTMVSIIDIKDNANGCNSVDEILIAGPCEYEVFIAIKPGNYSNNINIKSRGKVQVAILTTADFDADDVDPDTCVFAGASPVRWNMKDVDHDGDHDMFFHFMTQELDINKDSIEATMDCETLEGKKISGTDSVNILP